MKNPKSLVDFFKDYPLRTYPKDQIIFFEGEQIVETLIIAKGFVKVYDIDSNGVEKIFLIMESGSILPIFTNIDLLPLSYFGGALTSVDVRVVPTADFKHQLFNNSNVSKLFINYSLTKMRELMDRIATIERTGSDQRLIRVLLYLAKHHSKNAGNNPLKKKLTVPLTQLDIANLTGISRETTSIQLGELEKRRLIYNKNDYIIINLDKLEKASET